MFRFSFIQVLCTNLDHPLLEGIECSVVASHALINWHSFPSRPHYMEHMCNRYRGVRDWSQIPRNLAQARLNFDYNPNVAPTEAAPAFLAERGKQVAAKLSSFGIALAAQDGKK